MKKVLTRLFSWTLIWNVCRMFYWAYKHLTDNTVVEALHGDAFRRLLMSYLNMEPRIDFLGRVYGVINPSVANGKVDLNNIIFEIDGVNSNNYAYVENWIYKQLLSVSAVFGLDKSGFFDSITMNIKHVGPANGDNYLLVFDSVTRQMMSKSFKRVLKQAITYGAIVGFIWLIFAIYLI